MVPCICEPQIARTLTARGDGSPNVDGGPNIIAFEQNQRNELRDLHDVAGCLAAQAGVKQRTYIAQPAVGVHQNQASDLTISDTAYTLSTNSNATGCNAPLVAHPDVAGTLCSSGAGLSRPAGNANETDLCVVQSQSIPIQDKATRYKNGGSGNGLGIGKPGDPAYTMTTSDRSIVATADSAPSYIIRRLTPTEAERCISLPDGWTAYGHVDSHKKQDMRKSKKESVCTTNYILYCKQKGDKTFGATDLHRGRVGVGLMFATLVTDIDRAKSYADKLAADNRDYLFQVREAGKSKVVYDPNRPMDSIRKRVSSSGRAAR